MPETIEQSAGTGDPTLVASGAAARLKGGRRGRGQGVAMAHAHFRDPVGLDAEIAALQLRIARTLVGAPSLPVDLPAFDLTLLSVAAEKNAIDLVIGKSAPIAKLRLRRAAAGTGDGPSSRPVDVGIVELHRDTARFQRQLSVMQRRLHAAITADKWGQALDAARQL